MGTTQTTKYIIDVAGMSVLVTRKRVKNVNMRIGPDGMARMSVPWHMSRADAERIAREHEPWFRASLQRAERRRSDSVRSWEDGSAALAWGKRVTVRIKDDGERRCALVGDELVLWGASELDATAREKLAEAWYVGALRERVEAIRPECERRVGRRATSVTLRRMKTRWGSCTSRTGRIRLNTALAECPPDCTRMVLIHELCHLREANHGPRFHALMDLCCPDWRVTQRWLDEHPPRA
jgi:predicted metal-dependent hydrolase